MAKPARHWGRFGWALVCVCVLLAVALPWRFAAPLKPSRCEAALPHAVTLIDMVWTVEGPIHGVQDLTPNYGEVEIADGYARYRQYAKISRQGPPDGGHLHLTGLLPDGTALAWSQTAWARLVGTRPARARVFGDPADLLAPWRWDAATRRYVTYIARPGQPGRDLGIVEFDPARRRVVVVGKPLRQFRGPGFTPIGVTGRSTVWLAHNGRQFEVLAVDVSTGNATRHVWMRPLSVQPGTMALAPNGRQVAFLRFESAPSRNWLHARLLSVLRIRENPSALVCVCRPDGGGYRVVARETLDPMASNPILSLELCRWSPDCKRIAYQCRLTNGSCSVQSVPAAQ